jgi:metal-responsive CopG/Arc/MetJ family transcriptional regulator
MRKAAKIAISLPEELLQVVEARRKACGESRSEFIRQAVQDRLRREREQELVAQYIRGYTEHPETAEEVEEIEAWFRVGLEALAHEPWDDEAADATR